MSQSKVEQSYQLARERYAALGIDTDQAMSKLAGVPLSLHCWQGDDVAGFETSDASLSGGGIQVTGNYPGRARTVEELRADLDKALSLLPGKHRLNLHAIYGEFGGKKVDRDQITPENFAGWMEWAKARGMKLDFNATCFSHPKANDGFTLSNPDPAIRKFWIEHVKRAREIGAYFGKELGGASIHNLWIPDGSKDSPVERYSYRKYLKESLDEIFSVSQNPAYLKDAVESKLFGIGSESYVVGSHEFYMGYALSKGLMLCLDLGHFHPTESIADKISSLLLFTDELLLHVSRGVRWDSDHVVILGDDLRNLANEIVGCDALNRVHIALDYFDATINRVGAWVTGARATQKALLLALLQPFNELKKAEDSGNLFRRLALLEEAKSMPAGDVWNYFCMKNGAPIDQEWIAEVESYETSVLKQR